MPNPAQRNLHCARADVHIHIEIKHIHTAPVPRQDTFTKEMQRQDKEIERLRLELQIKTLEATKNKGHEVSEMRRFSSALIRKLFIGVGREANLRVRGITLSTQNCIQAGSCPPDGLGHINKHNSESSTWRTTSRVLIRKLVIYSLVHHPFSP